MPFITQCPHADCGRYMLMEEDARGCIVECLVCKQSIELEPIVLDVPKDGNPLALPDNASPFRVRGGGTFFYHDQSQSLAEAVQRRLVSVGQPLPTIEVSIRDGDDGTPLPAGRQFVWNRI